MPYREDEDALLARNDALEQQVAELTKELAAARVAGVTVVRRTPLWAWLAAGLAAGASAIAIIAMTTHTMTPTLVVAPDAAPEDLGKADAPPDAAPEPTAREDSVARLRYLLDTVDRDLRRYVSGYPAKLPAHAAGARLGLPSGWVSDDVIDEDLADAKGLAPTPAIADALAPYLDHLATWLPRWREIARYFSTGDDLDDDLAKLRGEDADLRASIARFLALSAALRTAVDTAWHADLASSRPDGDRAIYLAAWDACRTAVHLVLDEPAPDLVQPVAACRTAIDALRTRKLADDYTLGLYDQIYGTVATARRGGKADLGGLAQQSIYLAQQVRQHEDLLSP